MAARRGAAAGVAVAAAILGLSGCAALGGLFGTGQATPTASSAPPVAVAVPPLDCAAFTAAPPVETVLGGSAPLASTPADALTTPAGRGPFAVQAAGGGWCRWGDDPASDAAAATGSAGTASAPVHTLELQLLPHATAIWQRLTDQYPDSAAVGAHYDGGESRGGDCAHAAAGPGSTCHTNVLVGASWLAVDAVSSTSVIDEKAFHALVQSFLPAAASIDARTATATGTATPAAPSPALPSPSATAAPLPCGGADWLKAVAAAFGPQSVTTLEPGESFGMPTALLDVPTSMSCAYRETGDGAGGYLGTVSVLHGAAGAYADYHAAVVDHDPDASGGTIEHGGQQLPTLVRTTSASGSTPAETVIDALVGDTWIQFAAQAGSDDQAASVVQWVAGRL